MLDLIKKFSSLYFTEILGFCLMGNHFHQGVFVLPHLKNNINCLQQIMDNRLQMRYIRTHITLHPGGNRV